MALSGPQRPQLVYTQLRTEEIEAETLAKALELARKVEELLEDTRSIASVGAIEDASTHSTRMARAMAASLVDELDALVRPSRRTGSS
jgi:hypothetical protein